MKLAYADKRRQIGLPQAEPLPKNPETGEPWADWELDQIEELRDMTRGVMLILGLPGSGKSLLMTWLSWKLRKYFGQPVVTNIPFKPAFGEHDYIEYTEFLEELELMFDIVERFKAGDLQAFDESRLRRVTMIWDEGHQKLNKRRPMDGFNILLTETFSLWRHYESLFLLASPGGELLERIRLSHFVTHEVGASFNSRRGESTYTIYNRQTMETKILSIPVAQWCDLYHSFAPVAPSTRVLKGLLAKEAKDEMVILKARQMKEGLKDGKDSVHPVSRRADTDDDHL